MSEVARGEKLRVAPPVEIRPEEVSTAAPSTIQVTAVCGAVSTDILRVKTHVRLSVVPAYRVSVLLTVMDGAETGTRRKLYTCVIITNMHIFALFWDELTLYSNIQCGSVDSGSTESGSAGVLSSLRCCYITECEVTEGHLSTSGGVSWCRSYSRSHPLEAWSTSYSSRQSDRAGEGDIVSSHDGGGGGGERDGNWLCGESIHACEIHSPTGSTHILLPIVIVCAVSVSLLGNVLEVATMVME